MASLKTIHGCIGNTIDDVYEAEEIYSGTGDFIVTHIGEGVFLITFTPGFESIPAVVANAQCRQEWDDFTDGHPSDYLTCRLTAITEDTIKVQTGKASLDAFSPQDSCFTFMAVGEAAGSESENTGKSSKAETGKRSKAKTGKRPKAE